MIPPATMTFCPQRLWPTQPGQYDLGSGHGLGAESLTHPLNHKVEAGWIRNSHLRQRATVKFDPSLFQASDELGVTQATLTNCGMDAEDPQAAELALATTTVSVRVDTSPDDRFLGGTQQFATASNVSFDTLKQSLLRAMTGDGTFSTHDGGFR